jgi:hypothetical protein
MKDTCGVIVVRVAGVPWIEQEHSAMTLFKYVLSMIGHGFCWRVTYEDGARFLGPGCSSAEWCLIASISKCSGECADGSYAMPW